MTLLTAALLGMVQGLTEFLPVSSSAHLILVRALFGVDADAQFGLTFDVACHVGTLLAVVAFFWSEFVGMARALPQLFSARQGPDARRMRLIAVGTVPIVIVGLLGGATIEDTLRTPVVAVVTLFIGALFLFAAERLGRQSRREAELTMGHAVIIGIAQSTALVPGVSRSGATIGAGLLLGYERAEIARFTFMMGVPAILAAAAKKGLELRHTPLSHTDLQVFAIGIATSALVGYVAVRYLIRFLGTHRLDVFAWYRLALAAVLIVWLVTR